MRRIIPIVVFAGAVTLLSGPMAAQGKSPASGPTLAGAWTMNKDLSDAAPSGRGGDDAGSGSGSGRNGMGRGGGGGGRRGGFGGGFGGGGYGRGGGGAPAMNPEEMMRMRDALRDVTQPSEHLTITQSDTTVIITGADGRTTRLSTDGKKIKDDNTKVERKTKWDGGKLVSEISGLGSGKMTQTFSVDPDTKQLRIALVVEGKQARTISHIYDSDQIQK